MAACTDALVASTGKEAEMYSNSRPYYSGCILYDGNPQLWGLSDTTGNGLVNDCMGCSDQTKENHPESGWGGSSANVHVRLETLNNFCIICSLQKKP